MSEGVKEIRISVEISDAAGVSVLKIEERILTEGALAELIGILHQVHELAGRIRDEQAGLAKG